MWKINLKSIIVALLITVVGIVLVLINNNACISIGCSLIASAVLSILTALIVDVKKVDPLDEWNISKIYSTRSEKNADSDPNLDKARYCVDAVAFGLSSFRSKYSKKVEQALRKGVNFRIITMDPESDFIHAREEEEGAIEGNIQKSINDLVKWANELNEKSSKGKIIIKAYKCMTLDFYWRVDDTLYIGPYWYGYKSSDTITYCFKEGGKAFTQYSDYFDSLWENNEIMRTLTSETKVKTRRKKR
jgi:hypothetical protein